MPQYTILAGIVVGLALLLGMALTLQAAQTRSRERARLARALKHRAGQFAELFEKLPGSYRHATIDQLLLDHLQELHAHLTQMEPRVPAHASALQLWQARAGQAPPSPAAKPDIATAKELQAALDELYKLAYYRESEGRMKAGDAQACRQALKLCLAQLLADMHLASASRATQQQRTATAIHYLELSVRALRPVAEQQGIAERIRALEAQRIALQEEALQPVLSTLEAAYGDPASALWKKKQVYD